MAPGLSCPLRRHDATQPTHLGPHNPDHNPDNNPDHNPRHNPDHNPVATPLRHLPRLGR
jgi:hypothetical protein